MGKEIYRLLYTSEMSESLEYEDIEDIVAHARQNNSSLDITGMLLFIGDKFAQVLEGPKDAVEKLFTKIAGDSRHRLVYRVLASDVDKRVFPDWTMGLKIITQEDLEEMEKLNQKKDFNPVDLLSSENNFAFELMRHFYKTEELDFGKFWKDKEEDNMLF